MHTLTIDDHGHDVSITHHDTPEAAQSALHAYLVMADYYYRPTHLSATHTAYELLSLTQQGPRVVGVATTCLVQQRVSATANIEPTSTTPITGGGADNPSATRHFPTNRMLAR